MAKRSNNAAGGRRPGGGIGSRVNVEKPVRTGQRAEAINEKWVSQIGQAMGNKSTDSTKRLAPIEPLRGTLRPAGGPSGVDLGNAVAARTVCAPGGSREVMRAGSQGQKGSVDPGQPRPGADKPIWPGFR
jgi:hypothetical protein